jgi:hypothetical protein
VRCCAMSGGVALMFKQRKASAGTRKWREGVAGKLIYSRHLTRQRRVCNGNGNAVGCAARSDILCVLRPHLNGAKLGAHILQVKVVHAER